MKSDSRNWGLQTEVIFVDDDSTDDSLTELLKIKVMRPATKIVRLSRNFGAVAASKTGLKSVTGDCFVIVAADQQDPLEQVLLMAKHWLDGCKFVVSARLSRADPRLTRSLSAAYYAAIRLLVTSNYPRGGFDLMLMDRSMLSYMSQSAKNINPNMYAIWLGISPTILYYNRPRRLHGKSRWTLRKKVNFFIDTMTGFSVVPIRLLSVVGVIIAVLSLHMRAICLSPGSWADSP